jgi:iron complex outermembrane receptor protein
MPKRQFPQRKLAYAAAVLLQGVATGSQAQQSTESSASGIQTVEVTAQRRTQSLQEVPASVSAISAGKLDDARVISTQDIQQIVPNLTFATSAGEGHKANVVIRGVGLNSSSNLREANVGMYFDDVYLANTSGLTSALFDMERVEVLRGPQGTLYGNTVTGGLVHYISRKPTRTFEGFAAVDLGSYNTRRIEAAVGGALGAGGAARLSAVVDQHDGFVKNSIGSARNSRDDKAVRAQILLEPSKGVSLLFKAYGSDNTPSAGPAWKPRVAFLNPATGLGEAVAAGPCPAGCDSARNPVSIADGSIWSIASSGPSELRVKRSGAGLKADIQLGFATLTSVTDFSKVIKHYVEDSSGAPGQSTWFETDVNAKQFQQEFRLSGSSGGVIWNAGLFYMKRNDIDVGGVDFTPAIGKGFFPATLNYKDLQERRLKSTSLSLYGQVEFPLTKDLTAVAGLRAYRQDEDTRNSPKLLRIATGVVDVSPDIVASVRSDDPSGKIGLNWKLDKRTLVYGSVSRGARPGFAQNSTNPAAPPLVKPELLTAAEVGIKTDFAAVPVRLNASLYHYDYKQMQTNAFLGIASFQLNKDATVTGGEIELIAKPSANLELSGSLGLVDGKVKDVQWRLPNAATQPTYRDTELPNAPKVSASVQAKYSWEMAGGNAFALLNQSYRSATYGELENNPVQRVPAYSLTNVRFGYSPASGKWQAGLYVNNVFNKEYFTYIGFVSSIRIAQQFPGRPRWIGAYFNYSFD